MYACTCRAYVSVSRFSHNSGTDKGAVICSRSKKLYGGKLYMNKAELVEAVAEKTGLTKKDSEKALAAVVDTIVATLAKGEKVQLVGFGTFETRVHKERTNINPATKEKQVIPATTVPAFKPGKAFKDAVK